MEKMRTIIVDDEPLAREGIRTLLDRQPDVEVVAECESGATAVAALGKHRPDLLFLDVQMPGMNGFEVLGRLAPDRVPVVIFVTAFDRHALRAFEHHALDYLLKPFDDERFEQALQRARTQLEQQQAQKLSRRLLDVMADYKEVRGDADGPEDRTHSSFVTRLSVRSAGRVVFLKTTEIDWIEAADYYVKLHVVGKSHLLRESMNRLEAQLDPRQFLRIHRSTIVNVERVSELRPQTQGESMVCLADGTELRVSRSRRDKLNALLGRPR